MIRTANPAFRSQAFQETKRWDELADAPAASKTMTVNGTVWATGTLLGVCIGSAMLSWMAVTSNPGLALPLLFGGMIAGLVVFLIMMFKPATSPFLGFLYAGAEGAFLGSLSLVVAQQIDARMPAAAEGAGSGGTVIVLQAVLLTFGILAAMLLAYATRIIRPGKIFRAVVVSATIGIMFYYLIAFVLSLFGVTGMASVMSFQNGSMLSIGFSLFVVAIASLNLVLDFQFIEEGSKQGLPKYMEWFGGVALLVTLVWLYVEVLRLLAKLQSRD